MRSPKSPRVSKCKARLTFGRIVFKEIQQVALRHSQLPKRQKKACLPLNIPLLGRPQGSNVGSLVAGGESNGPHHPLCGGPPLSGTAGGAPDNQNTLCSSRLPWTVPVPTPSRRSASK